MKKITYALRMKMNQLYWDKSGDMWINLLIGVVISVILGGVILTLSQTSINELWTGIINKFKSVFSL